MKKFKILSIFTSVLCFYLFCILFFFPQSFFTDMGIEGNETAYFLARRASMLMLGISVLMFFARSIPHSQARQAISLGICVTMSGFAMTGTYEFMRGFIGNNILPAIIVESSLSISFFYIWLSNKYKRKA